MWKRETLKLCRTVGELVEELQKLPASAKLIDRKRPVYFNTCDEAKRLGLKPGVSFVND